jgi:hypothetical protein
MRGSPLIYGVSLHPRIFGWRIPRPRKLFRESGDTTLILTVAVKSRHSFFDAGRMEKKNNVIPKEHFHICIHTVKA